MDTFQKAVCEWNKKKTIKTFISLYRNGFTYYTLLQNPIWRIYRIAKNTVTGKYRWCESELKKDGEGNG